MNNKSHRQTWLNVYRIASIVLLCTILILVSVGLIKSESRPSVVERAAVHLEEMGFKNPEYLGIKQATEGEYPTYRVVCLGGETLEVIVRTNPGGGWGVQPSSVPYWHSISSAFEFARIANEAVSDKKYGNATKTQEEIDMLYEYFKKYEVDYNEGSYPSETDGWPL